MDFIVLSLGSNVGDRAGALTEARQLLEERGVRIVRQSSLYESEPVGFTDQDPFLNQVLIVETDQTPEELLETCLGVENHMGRIRVVKNGPRKIDVDILFFKDQVLSEDNLLLPHPRITDRRFILEPLVELMPDAHHPVLDEALSQLLQNCEDQHRVERYQ